MSLTRSVLLEHFKREKWTAKLKASGISSFNVDQMYEPWWGILS